MPRGARRSSTRPKPRAIGSKAITVVKVVSRIGRKRRAPEWRTASRSGIPPSRARLMKSTITSESFTTTPVKPMVAYIKMKLTL